MVAKVDFTWGKSFFSVASRRAATRMVSSSEVEGMPVTRNMMLPSCNVGMNSLPRKGNVASAASSNTSAPPKTFFLFSSAQASKGR